MRNSNLDSKLHRIKKPINKSFTRDLGVYLLFVLLATIIWVINAIGSRRVAVYDLPIVYSGISADYVITNAMPRKLRIELEDDGLDHFTRRNANLVLHFDVSSQVQGSDGTITIELDQIRQEIVQHLSGDAQLVGFTPESLSGSYALQDKKVVPVIFDGDIQTAAQYQLTSKPTCTPSEIMIYGLKNQLESVNEVRTELVEIDGVQESMSLVLGLIAPDSIRLGQDSILLTICTEQFTEKELMLPIHTPIMDDGLTLHVFPNQAKVTFRIPTNLFASVNDSTDIELYVDIPTEKDDILNIKAHINNQNISQLHILPKEVEYLIKQQ